MFRDRLCVLYRGGRSAIRGYKFFYRTCDAASSQYDSWTNLILPSLTGNLQIGYAALSLSIPERVHFRYKLEGIDKDWEDAGTRREAFYTKLGPVRIASWLRRPLPRALVVRIAAMATAKMGLDD
jgi:hypothetical protein